MKKVFKFFCLLLIIYLAICQVSNQVRAYSTEEWKEIIEYKEVATDGEPIGPDITINIDNLEPNAGFPLVQTTLELLLFGKEAYVTEDREKFADIMKGIDFFDIDFLNQDSTNTNDTWKKVRDLVQLVFRVSLYITIAAMLTQLIYIGIIIVKSAIFGENNKLPYEKQILAPYKKYLRHREGNVNRNLIHKKLIEQWIITLALLVFIVIGLSLINNFSKLILANDEAEREMLNIEVYVKDESNTSTTSNRGYYFKANIESILIFQSQHLVKKFAFQDFYLILRAFIVIICKYVIALFLLIRLFIVAVSIAISPLLVFANGIIKANGNKGFLRKWLIIYLVMVMSKPLIAALYGII